MTRRHCIIVNRGGAVLAAFTDDPSLVVTLVDRDNIEAGDPMPALPEGVEDSDSGLIVPDGWRDALSDAAGHEQPPVDDSVPLCECGEPTCRGGCPASDET